MLKKYKIFSLGLLLLAPSIYGAATISEINETIANTIRCNICYINRKKSDFRKLNCGHSFCFNCLKTYINEKSIYTPVIKCLNDGCPGLITLDSMPNLGITRETMARLFEKQSTYDRFIDLTPIGKAKACILLHCEICPNPRCRLAIEKASGCPRITCPCGQGFCWLCNAPRNDMSDPNHDNIKCQQIAQIRYKKDAEIERRKLGEEPVLTFDEIAAENPLACREAIKDQLDEAASSLKENIIYSHLILLINSYLPNELLESTLLSEVSLRRRNKIKEMLKTKATMPSVLVGLISSYFSDDLSEYIECAESKAASGLSPLPSVLPFGRTLNAIPAKRHIIKFIE